MHLGTVTTGRADRSRDGSRCRSSSLRSWSGRCSGRRRSYGRFFLGSRGRSGGASDFQLEDQVAGADFVTDLDRHAFHHASGRRGDFHARLVRLQGDQRLVGFHRVTGLDHHLDDAGLAGRADVRNVDVLHAGSRRRSGGCGLRGCCRRCGSRSRLFSLGGRCFGGSGATLGFQFEDFVAFLQLVAELDLDALDHPGLRAGDFHAGLVRLQGQQALIGLDLVADLDQQFDHFTFAAADIGYANQFTHRASPQQSSGLRFSGSIPSLTMASATTFGSMSPRSASASSAASTTQLRSTSKK
ncbi:hypothetical protein D3C78_924160 [compost metagenome]